MKEQQIQSKIINDLHSMGAYVVKVISASKDGVPDIIGCINGLFFAIEVKKDAKCKATKLQMLNLDRISKSKGLSFVSYGYDDYTNNIKPILMEVIND